MTGNIPPQERTAPRQEATPSGKRFFMWTSVEPFGGGGSSTIAIAGVESSMAAIGLGDGGNVKRDIDLRQLRAFLSVVEEGGFVRAARALRRSQSTVSAAIRALERQAGGAVLRRAGGRVALTPIGEALLPYARQLLALNSELQARRG